MDLLTSHNDHLMILYKDCKDSEKGPISEKYMEKLCAKIAALKLRNCWGSAFIIYLFRK